MKIYIIFALILTSLSTYARQYIQCSDLYTNDRTVINLNGEESTLFLTTGLDDPNEIRILKSLFFQTENDTSVFYQTNEGPILDTVEIPKEIIGKYSDYFKVLITLENTQTGAQASRELSCYSAIYE